MNKILSFIIFYFFISCQKDEIKTITFKGCKVEYMSYTGGQKEIYENHSISNQWELESAKRKLALCLCEKYLTNPNVEIKNKILEIYNAKEEYFEKDYPKNLTFDTILKKRMDIFDPTILLD